MGKTKIQWTDFSVNPIRAEMARVVIDENGYAEPDTPARGHYCEKVSPGCKNCYASRLQPRFQMPQFQEQRRHDVNPYLDAKALESVLRRRKPTRFFWCDMSDMFGEWVPNEWIAACFGVMAATPQHTHQVLTKRAKRMREWFEWIGGRYIRPLDTCHTAYVGVTGGRLDVRNFDVWPLPSVWLGVSAEDQQRADERIPHLLATPAAVRFVSAEPLLGPLLLLGSDFLRGEAREYWPWLRSIRGTTGSTPSLDWVICGSESGPGARPMRIEWAESLRDQCAAAGVRFFTKQIANEHDRKGGDPKHWPAGPWPREFAL